MKKGFFVAAKRHTKNLAKGAAFLAFASAPMIANAAGGLDESNDFGNTIRLFIYSILGIACGGVAAFYIIMALLGKRTWADVFIMVPIAVGAGGVMAAIAYAWGIYGDGDAYSS